MPQTVVQRIGRYELGRPLGSGGIGTVFEAIDSETGASVAVKLFRPSSADPSAIGRFLAIQRRLKEMRHPRLVSVLDCGVEQDQPWVVTERAAGSLRPLVGDAPLSVPAAVRVVHQVAEALQAIHDIGILHGNLKLSNILLSADGNIVVGDIGTDVLGLGIGVGYQAVQTTPSPAYMSPEQGRQEPTDERSDVYSLGVILYELLTAEVPFWGYDTATVLVKRELQDLTPPSRLNPEVPPALDDIVDEALALEPERRYATCSALADALRSFYAGPLEPAVTEGDRADQARAGPGLDAGLRVVCPVCGFGNPSGRHLCLNCWSPLERGEIITAVEDERRVEAIQRGTALRRRLELGASVAVVVLAAVGIWTFLRANEPVLPPSPTTSVGVSTAAGQWASLGRTPDRMSNDAQAPSLSGDIRWTFETSTQIYSSPVSANGRVYLSAGDRRIVALDAATGKAIWESPTNGPVDSTPAVAGGRLYVGLRDGSLISIDAATGVRGWAYLTAGPISSSPTVADGTVYVGSGDKTLYAFDAFNGTLRWRLDTEGWLSSSPAVGDSIVAIGGRDWNVYTVDKATGWSLMVYRLGFSPTEATPAVVGDTVYIGASDHILRALAGRTVISWWDTEWRIITSQLFRWGVIGTPPESKGLIWRFATAGRRDNRITGVLAVNDDTVYVGAWDNRLYAVDRATGTERWHFQVDSPLQGGPALAGNTVYVASYEGTVYAVDAESGEKRWSLPLQTRITSTPAVGDGLLFVTGVNGVLYAIE